MTKEARSHSNSYIIRIWREEGKPGWKGWVQHARTGESGFFQRLDELLAFIERHAGKLAEPPPKGLK
ncbi:MAG: hypothetical protein JXM73_25225 [Anaerolineae bacterium]|nr:hypothetical protein [Anaerolineae bacterium]